MMSKKIPTFYYVLYLVILANGLSLVFLYQLLLTQLHTYTTRPTAILRINCVNQVDTDRLIARNDNYKYCELIN